MPSSTKQSRDVIDSILRWTETGLTCGQIINSVVPIPAYGLISEIIKALIHQIAAARGNEQDAVAVLEKIQTLANIIKNSREKLIGRIARLSRRDQKRMYNGVQDKPPFEDLFDKFLEDLMQLKALSEGLKHEHYILCLVFSSEDAKIIQKIQVGVLNATEFFKTQCHVATLAYLEQINNRVKKIHATVKNTEIAVKTQSDRDILESLPHANTGYRTARQELKGRFLKGTRSALFAKLEKWVERGSSDKPVCILSGGAGTGKSVIASELAKRLDNQGKLGASFFFARDVTDLNSTRMFFSTIAYQLAHWTEGTLRKPIIDTARAHLEKGTSQALKYEAQALLHRPLESADKQKPIFIVVDAIDECTQDAFKLVPKMLDRVLQGPVPGLV